MRLPSSPAAPSPLITSPHLSTLEESITFSSKRCLTPLPEYISGFGGSARVSKKLMPLCIVSYITPLCKLKACFSEGQDHHLWLICTMSLGTVYTVSNLQNCTCQSCLLPIRERDSLYTSMQNTWPNSWAEIDTYSQSKPLFNEWKNEQPAKLEFLQWRLPQTSGSQSVGLGQTASVSPGNLLKYRFSGPTPDWPTQNLWPWELWKL